MFRVMEMFQRIPPPKFAKSFHLTFSKCFFFNMCAILHILLVSVALAWQLTHRNVLTPGSAHMATRNDTSKCLFLCSNCSNVLCSRVYNFLVLSENQIATTMLVNSLSHSSMFSHCFKVYIGSDGTANFDVKALASTLHKRYCCSLYSVESLIYPKGISRHLHGAAVASPKFPEQVTKYRATGNWARFYVPDLLPNEDSVLVLDEDVAVVKDPRVMWFSLPFWSPFATCGRKWDLRSSIDLHLASRTFFDLFGKSLGSWKDSVAGGVMLVNVKVWKALGVSQEIDRLLDRQVEEFRSTGRHIFTLGTIVPLNFIARVHGHILPASWHKTKLGFITQRGFPDAVFLHFNGANKPWKRNGINRHIFRTLYPHDLFVVNHATTNRGLCRQHEYDRLCFRDEYVLGPLIACDMLCDCGQTSQVAS